MSAENWTDLISFPGTRPEVVRAVRTHVGRTDTELRISYRLEGDLARVLVPFPAEPTIGVELWRHTCFEVFIRIEGATAYHEFNFAPSSQWTIYAFSDYRDGAPLSDASMSPHIDVRSSASRLELDATIQLERLSSHHPHAVLRLGLAAVIETSAGLSYWALHHPADRPDFHNAESFGLRLEPPAHRPSPQD